MDAAEFTTLNTACDSHVLPIYNDLSVASLTHTDVDTWHNRLGHPSHKHIAHLKDMFYIHLPKTQHICTVCPLAKQKILSF